MPRYHLQVLDKCRPCEYMTHAIEQACQERGDQRIHALLEQITQDDVQNELECELLQERENCRVYQVQPGNPDRITMKGVILLQNSSCQEVMDVLGATDSMKQTMHAELFGSLYIDSTSLYESTTNFPVAGAGMRRKRSDLNATPLDTSMEFNWLMLRDPYNQVPRRDFVYMQYNQIFPSEDPVARDPIAWGASIYESVQLPTCGPIFSTRRVTRKTFEGCGFLVEASADSATTRVTFVISTPYVASTAAGDHQWLMEMASSVRRIPSAIVHHRIRLNHIIDKRQWKSSDMCLICSRTFSILKCRKHHCRMCGMAICSKCSTHCGSKRPIRVCVSCLNGKGTGALWGNIQMTRNNTPPLYKFDSLVRGSMTESSYSDDSMYSNYSIYSGRYSVEALAPQFRNSLRVPSMDIPIDDSSVSTMIEEDEDDVVESTSFSYSLTYAKNNIWPDAPIPADEKARLQRIKSLNLSQKYAKDTLTEIVKLAKTSVECPVAAVVVISVSKCLVVTSVGLDADQIPRDIALEAHVIMAATPLVVLDTRTDKRFASNPLVSKLNIRFFIGIPLISKEGIVIGALTLGDTKARSKVSGSHLRSLQCLASRIVNKMDAKNITTTQKHNGVLLLPQRKK